MKSTRVLIVDDEPGIRESLTGVLEDEGIECSSVGSGEECLAELSRQNFDVILLDVWLPGMDGLETLARVQELPFADRPEIVIISGHGTIETAVKATKLGAFDFLEKPFQLDALLRMVDELHDTASISDETWAQLEKDYDRAQLVSLPMIVGAYHQVAYTFNALRVPEPDPARGGLAAR